MASMEAAGFLHRIDPSVVPTSYRCATVSMEELEQLRRVTSVVRKGRIAKLEPGMVHLEHGMSPVSRGATFVDCTANGLSPRPSVPVFADGSITLQSIILCQQVFSAALIAKIEVDRRVETPDDARNKLCRPCPHPNEPKDYLPAVLITLCNFLRCAGAFPRFVNSSRLFIAYHDSTDPDPLFGVEMLLPVRYGPAVA